ncbi:MAG: hypothetical protein KAT28_04830 [Candidatus Aenigmarchaeota archaeon]|nr:hypothetical protein [Candidatus Aenigmarchaeota archaeon]
MRVYTKFGMDWVCPFLGWSKVPNFEYISDEEKATIDKYFNEVEQEIVADKNPASTFHELSQYMQKSDDKQLRALGSQMALTANLMRKYPEVF